MAGLKGSSGAARLTLSSSPAGEHAPAGEGSVKGMAHGAPAGLLEPFDRKECMGQNTVSLVFKKIRGWVLGWGRNGMGEDNTLQQAWAETTKKARSIENRSGAAISKHIQNQSLSIALLQAFLSLVFMFGFRCKTRIWMEGCLSLLMDLIPWPAILPKLTCSQMVHLPHIKSLRPNNVHPSEFRFLGPNKVPRPFRRGTIIIKEKDKNTSLIK